MANETYYLFNDYFKDTTTADISVVNDVGADKEDAAYPKENAKDEQIGLCSRSDDKTNIKIRFDINSASGGVKALKAFFIGNHNFSGGSAKIYSYTANDYATGQVLEATVAVRLLDMFVRIAAPGTKRYWEIDLSHNGSVTSAAAYFEWGRIMCYTDFTILTEIEDEKKGRTFGFRNIINETSFGVRWSHKMNEDQEGFDLTWSIRTQANLPSELRTLFSLIDGRAHPFVYIPDIAATNVYYVYSKADILRWTEIGGVAATDIVASVNLGMIEAVRGKSV